jgi:tetratricopeptide (TPR) repeat protein
LEKAQSLVKEFNHYFPEENILNALLGTRCLLLGQYECAREFLWLATLQNPRKYGEYLIATQMLLGNFEEAQKLYEVANEYFPDNSEFLEGYALVLAKLERFQEAEVIAQKASSLAPNHPRIEKLLRSIEAQIYFDQQSKKKSAS